MQKIKVSLIGYGYWGPKLARNFQNSNYFNLVSIIDTSNKNLKKAKIDFPLVKVSKNYKDILKFSKISLVVISTPTKTHFKIAKFALENKKHVLVEKPLSIKLNEVKSLENLSKKNNSLLFVDYPFIFSGSIKYIKKIIESKKYGNLIEIESFREKAPIRKDCDVVWDLSVHDISILNFLLNNNPIKYSSLKISTLNKKLADTAYLNLVYKNKINVFLKNSWISPDKVRLIKFKFKKAIIHCDENEQIYKIKVFHKKNINNLEFKLEIPEVNLTEPLSVLVDYIYKSIKNNTNKIFDNNLNINITKTLKKLS
mgnify:FL=1|tara:strand:- start:3503 stop:4438 length:936 start_codon:yes stop_codon:yes gene_type:complete